MALITVAMHADWKFLCVKHPCMAHTSYIDCYSVLHCLPLLSEGKTFFRAMGRCKWAYC